MTPLHNGGTFYGIVFETDLYFSKAETAYPDIVTQFLAGEVIEVQLVHEY